ncbi:hypothetical protein JB92DRAFT_2204289 [Gautieria morchelliformis]|nr:hypothetical protein JB92DRAFT_2204289 [Gautieria morchelliformis]
MCHPSYSLNEVVLSSFHLIHILSLILPSHSHPVVLSSHRPTPVILPCLGVHVGVRSWTLVHPSRPAPLIVSCCPLTVACITSPSSSDAQRHHLNPLNSKGLEQRGTQEHHDMPDTWRRLRRWSCVRRVDVMMSYGGGVGEGESSAYMERSCVMEREAERQVDWRETGRKRQRWNNRSGEVPRSSRY